MSLLYQLYGEPASGRLHPLKDGRFQLVDYGPVTPFYSGYGYLIVERTLATFLAELPIERVRYENAILFDPESGAEHDKFVRIHVGQYFSHDQISDLDLDGLRLLAMNDEYLFVNSGLKDQLEQSPFDYLRFSEGLSSFAA